MFSSTVASARSRFQRVDDREDRRLAEPVPLELRRGQRRQHALTAAFVARSLSGKKAQWAGEKSLASKTRSFGLVYPTTTGFDLAGFEP